MAGQLATKNAVVAAQGGFDERVAHSLTHGHTAFFLDEFGHRPGGAQVVDDVGSGLAFQQLARD